MTLSPLRLHAVFHLNISYSSIAENQRRDVLENCYWPLVRLLRDQNLPFAIEASAITLEAIAGLDPDWLREVRHLVCAGRCEFVGSGYTQLIGPLVPAEVVAANLRLGNQAYEKLVGVRPRIALINEQAYSGGLVEHYLDAGYRAIVMEWDNSVRHNEEWHPEWRYLPQAARGPTGLDIPVVWNSSIAFQKFQRYAHSEITLTEYLDYLASHVGGSPRVFPLYGNDVEVFDFRPGRYHTEEPLAEKTEWERISTLCETLAQDDRFCLIGPSGALELLGEAEAGKPLRLESPEKPIVVKKQRKYNICRWAVTGRNDLRINTECWRAFQELRGERGSSDESWKELCYLWSSDFRTHITEERWQAFRTRLRAFRKRTNRRRPLPSESGRRGLVEPKDIDFQYSTDREGRFLTVETDSLRVRLNCRRGLAVDALCFKHLGDEPMVGTLPLGFYDDIGLGADFYTGHLLLEAPAEPKVTDLNWVEPHIDVQLDQRAIEVAGTVASLLGELRKVVRIDERNRSVDIEYDLNWPQIPSGSFRLGHVTLLPSAFEKESLYYRVHNGGFQPEHFEIGGTDIDHGAPISFLVSAGCAVGMTGGWLDMGDARRTVRISIDRDLAAVIGMIAYRELDDSFFLRAFLSAQEMDETSRPESRESGKPLTRFRVSIAGMCTDHSRW